MAKIRKGDEVVVRAGKDKGKRGTVLTVSSDDRVVVEGINLVKRHTKPNPQRNVGGGIIEKEMPIHISNLLPLDPGTNQPTRVSFLVSEDGSKLRVAKKSGQPLGTVRKTK